MKKCICKAMSHDPFALAQLCADLRGLGEGLKPYLIGEQAFVEFHDRILLPLVMEMFEQFEHYGFYVEF